jgi:hypothetical protein
VLVLLLAGAEVQSGAVRVRHEAQAPEAQRVAAALERAVAAMPAFVEASGVEVRARLAVSIEEFTALTGLPATAAAGVIEDEIVFPPARVTARFDDLDLVARHEVAHLSILRRWGKGLPRWFIEGFASNLAGTTAADAGLAGCDRKGQLLNLDAMLVASDTALREGAYRRAAQATKELSRLAGGPERLWNLLPQHPTRKSLAALRPGGKTFAQVYEAAATCR